MKEKEAKGRKGKHEDIIYRYMYRKGQVGVAVIVISYIAPILRIHSCISSHTCNLACIFTHASFLENWLLPIEHAQEN